MAIAKLNHVKGPKGDDGKQGIAGPKGPKGDKGERGERGVQGSTGFAGPAGANGPPGADGSDGVGVPVGGTTGQVLAKNSNTDYDTEWVDQSGGGGSITGAANVGSGVEVFQEDNVGTLEFRTITSDSGIGVNQGADEINLSFNFSATPSWSEPIIDPNDVFLVYNTASGSHEQLSYSYLISQLNNDLSVSDFKFNAENKDAGALSIGMAVATHTSGTGVNKARADSNATRCIGLSLTATNPSFTATIQTGGVFTLANWTSIIGSASLSANTVYYLDPSTAGLLTSKAPTTAGLYVQRVGTAVSPTSLEIEIEQPIFL